MKYEKLGKTELSVSRITFGCWELGGGPWVSAGDENNIRAIHSALDHGITSFDTAEGYGGGHSERVLAKALKGNRQKCVIATKVSPNHLKPLDVRVAVEDSLRRLNTDYIDLYYIHWPNAEIPIEETISEFNKLKKEGLIRATGASNFSLEQLKAALDVGEVDAIQPEYSLLKRDIEKELLPFCLEKQISVLSYSSIAKGILTGIFHLGKQQLEEDDFRKTRHFFSPEQLEKEAKLIYLLKEIADLKGTSLSQIAISWLLHQPGLTAAIVGTQSEKHLIDNIQSVNVILTQDEMDELDSVSKQVIAELG